MNYKNGTQKHGLPVWKGTNSLKKLLNITDANGVFLYDENGKRYFDWNSGVRCVWQHKHPKIEKVRKEYDGAQFVPLSTTTPQRDKLCAQISQRTGLPRVFLPESGTGATAAAIQFAWSFFKGTKRKKILSIRPRSYHGGVGFVLELGDDARRNLVPHCHEDLFHKVSSPPMFCGETEGEKVAQALHSLSETIRNRGSETIAAMILEPVIGTGGVYPLPKAYLVGVQEILRKNGILFITDEIMSGCGRTGKMLAGEHSGITPDMVLLGKGLTNAVFPLAAVAVNEEIAKHFENNVVPAGSTFNAHPFGCAIASRVLEVFEEEKVFEHVAAMEVVACKEMQSLVDEFSCVKEFRLLGLFGAIELQSKQGEPFLPNDLFVQELQCDLQSRGLLTLFRGGTVMCSPPLTITANELKEGFQIMRHGLRACSEAFL
ncbi:MAG: aspartate aminotransferase family protein [Candidatus Pacebacteria bacterium]|nr:aspartate aminotransferase family protein [Candidatus Paceibacterota bacterium]